MTKMALALCMSSHDSDDNGAEQGGALVYGSIVLKLCIGALLKKKTFFRPILLNFGEHT